MRLSILNKLLNEKGWAIAQKRQGHYLLINSERPQAVSFLVPMGTLEQVPEGTLNATLRAAHHKGQAGNWLSAIGRADSLRVILEKHPQGMWGRIELPGLVVLTRGCCDESIVNTLRALLIDVATPEPGQYRPALENIKFHAVYDMTAVWEVVKQVKTHHIADKAGIDTHLIGQFMTGSTFPCIEEASRLEASIRELGRQLMQVAVR